MIVYFLYFKNDKEDTLELRGSDPVAGWGGGKKHEIYVAAFGGHLFYDLFLQGWRGEP